MRAGAAVMTSSKKGTWNKFTKKTVDISLTKCMPRATDKGLRETRGTRV